MFLCALMKIKYIDEIVISLQNAYNRLDSVDSDAGEADDFSLHER